MNTDVEQALAATESAIASLRVLLEAVDPPPPAGELTLRVTDLTASTIRVEWSVTGPDPATPTWTIGRDGTDSGGTGPWSTTVPGTTRAFVFSKLRPGTEYTITLVGAVYTSQVKATTTTTVPPPFPPPSWDGIQAAVLQAWGPILDGDEFEQSTGGRPLADRWGIYVSEGHARNGQRVREAWTVKDGICVCAGDENVNSGGMAFTRWSGKTYRVEARMQLVELPGSGAKRYHPCLIMWPDGKDDWPKGGEDDFAETNMGSGLMEVFIHHPNQTDGGAQETAHKTLDLGQWHNYAAERTSSSVTVWIDGVQLARFTNREVLNPPRNLHPTAQLDANSKEKHRPAELRLAWYRIYKPPT